LPNDRQVVGAVNPLLALGRPALVSAFSKKSFSSVSCPILACMVLMSGLANLAGALPKTCEDFS